MNAPASTRRGIQSVGIGMRVLMAVAAMPGPSTLSSIAQRAALSASQAHRYLASLIASGMLKQDERSGLYDLDSGAIRIGLAALSRIDLFANADRHMAGLVDGTGRTGLIAVWGDHGPTVIRLYPGSPPVMTAISIGSALPLLRSAMGRVFYAFGPRREMERQALMAKSKDPMSVPDDLAALRGQIRSDGSASVRGDLIPGLRAVAAPVLDLQGNLALVAALIAGSAFAESNDDAVGEALRQTCHKISGSIGGVAGPDVAF